MTFCHQFKDEKIYGTYGNFGAPILMVNDPNLIKGIMIRDFNYFVDRMVTLELFSGTAHTDKVWQKQIINLRVK